MGFWEWLVTPGGIELTHAIIGLVAAITVAIGLTNRSRLTDLDSKLDRHIQQVSEGKPK